MIIMIRKIYRLTLLLVPLACTNDAPPPPDEVPSTRASSTAAVPPDPVVLFLGTSLTAGLGVDPEAAFPALVQARIDSLEWAFAVENMGVSGETSAGGAYEEKGFVLFKQAEGFPGDVFCAWIESGGWLVEYHDFGVSKRSSGKCDSLALSS